MQISAGGSADQRSARLYRYDWGSLLPRVNQPRSAGEYISLTCSTGNFKSRINQDQRCLVINLWYLPPHIPHWAREGRRRRRATSLARGIPFPPSRLHQHSWAVHPGRRPASARADACLIVSRENLRIWGRTPQGRAHKTARKSLQSYSSC